MNAITKWQPSEEMIRQIGDAIDAAHAENTKRAYAADLATYRRWAVNNAAPQQPPITREQLAGFILWLGSNGYASASIVRIVGTVARWCKQSGQPFSPLDEATRLVLRGVRKRLGTKQEQKIALTAQNLFAMIDLMPRNAIGKRDRALLLLGFALAARRSELVALRWEDITWKEHGIEVTIRKSKTDQLAEGYTIGVVKQANEKYCPVAALIALAKEEDRTGFIFRKMDLRPHHIVIWTESLHPQEVSRCVKRYGEAIGLPAVTLGGHSLRAGHITEALRNGASPLDVMAVSRHTSYEMLKKYERRTDIIERATTNQAFGQRKK